MSFASLGERPSRKIEHDHSIRMVNNGPPPAYDLSSGQDDWNQYWFDVRHWNKKTLIFSVLALVVVIVIVIAVAVVEVKKNAYPDYAKLNYALVDEFSGTSFFDNFDYFMGYDPTAGFVHYLNLEQATQFNLTFATSSSAIIKVDTSQQNTSTGRYSVRVTSKRSYNNGLFIFDVVHTPYGCATWPALWLTDPSNWPMHGEIDIMEAVNQANTGNQMTLHTTDGCSMSVKRKGTGNVLTDNCYNGTNSNSGCGVQGDNSTFGPPFNAAGGAIVAMEMRKEGIRMWQFGHSNVPSDIINKAPDPSSWPEALADFPSTSCDIGSHFANLSIIADIDICGSWAGSPTVFSTQDRCPGLCTDYAAVNPLAFSDAYWEFGSNGFRVYQAI